MKTVDVTAPCDGAVIGKVPVSTGSEVEAALSTAHALYRDMRTEKMMVPRSDEL